MTRANTAAAAAAAAGTSKNQTADTSANTSITKPATATTTLKKKHNEMKKACGGETVKTKTELNSGIPEKSGIQDEATAIKALFDAMGGSQEGHLEDLNTD